MSPPSEPGKSKTSDLPPRTPYLSTGHLSSVHSKTAPETQIMSAHLSCGYGDRTADYLYRTRVPRGL
ncbi:hypothetical protein Y032_0457g1794 [Ancylostoma ceylanicum]|uniref:Uncharacterized protein n=1 Tax=Ancylostoma ceylanicum TaxID=53326 RepID=A0A016WZ89_9BILA|nr:hypothetical protein Y032_0457g1794 [Ancylostoma ceylanicum]